ncbi:MAG: sulfate adenylyltransferase subunit CysD [Hyphomonadaceae bacterium]|nr:sulfate adenylyltransferase subunit CysD [Hyphomonadaceae bacterium]
MSLSHLDRLEAEAIHILRDGVAEAERPALLFSGGKDSTVLAHVAARAFYPAAPPLPLVHVDSTFEFADLLAFRDTFAAAFDFRLMVHVNEEGRRLALHPERDGAHYTRVMRTEALKQALDAHRFDVVFGGARRDEEKTRAKERIVSVRNAQHGWDPRKQRPELWSNYNWRRGAGETLRVFPLSNWTEDDIWTYICTRRVPLAPLYFAAPRPVVARQGALIVVDDPARMIWRTGETAAQRQVRFRTLGCWPVTAAIESAAASAEAIIAETRAARLSERQGRISDQGSLEALKREGYF